MVIADTIFIYVAVADAISATGGRVFELHADRDVACAEGARQLARNRQGHGGDAAFRGAVGGLPDLPLECSHRSGIDNHTALAIRVGRITRHRRRSKPQRVETADQIDVDDTAETLERVRAVDGLELEMTPEIEHTFRGNDFHFRRGIIGELANWLKKSL